MSQLNALERTVKADPREARAQARYGTALVEAGQAIIGIDHLRKAVTLNPKLIAAWHNLGLAAERQGWLDDAADAYAHVVAAEPDHAGMWVKLGYIDLQLGRYDVAERAFRRSAALQPNSSGPLVAIASMQYAEFRYNAALVSLQRAATLNPHSAAAYANMAAIQIELGKMVEAETAIRSALKIEPDTPRYHLVLGHILAASPQAVKRDEARQELQHALEQGKREGPAPLSDTEEAEADHFLGVLARLTGQQDQAISYWRHALALDPTRPDTMLNLGHALVSLGGAEAVEGRKLLADYKRSQALRGDERELRQRVEEHPNDGAARLRYGKLLLAQGNVARAVWELREAARLRPEDTDARQALADALRRQGRD